MSSELYSRMMAESCCRQRAQGGDGKGVGTQKGSFCVPGPAFICCGGRRLRPLPPPLCLTYIFRLCNCYMHRRVKKGSSWDELQLWVTGKAQGARFTQQQCLAQVPALGKRTVLALQRLLGLGLVRKDGDCGVWLRTGATPGFSPPSTSRARSHAPGTS